MGADSRYISSQILKQIFPDFTKHFRNDVSSRIYFADLCEYLNFCKKDILQTEEKDADSYYNALMKRIRNGELKHSTVKKKIKELHKFSDFITENRDMYEIPSNFDNYFYKYAVNYFSEDIVPETISVKELDALFSAAQDDWMEYTILTLVCRMGLKSTQVMELREEDIILEQDNGYISISKNDIRYIPEDVAAILHSYKKMRKPNPYFFFNSRGNKLNNVYLHRMMRKLTGQAHIKEYSVQDLRNLCACIMFSYEANDKQVARQLGITQLHVKRYENVSISYQLGKEANDLVNFRVKPPRI